MYIIKDYLNINGGKSAAFALTSANGQTFPLPPDKDEKPQFRQARYQGYSFQSLDPGNEVKVPSHSTLIHFV